MQYSHMVQGELFKGGQAKHLPKYTGYNPVNTAHVIINLLCYWSVLGWRCSHLHLCFSAKLPIKQSQSLCHCRSFFLPRSTTWHLFLLNFIRLLSASYCSLATMSLRISTGLSNLVSPANISRLDSFIIFTSLLHLLNKQRAGTDPCSSEVFIHFQVKYGPLNTNFWLWPSNQFFTYLIVLSSL